MGLKDELIKKFAPYIFREILRFIYFKECIFKSKNGLESLTFSKRIVLKTILDAYRFPEKTLWTTLFVPSEILYAMDLKPFCLEIGGSLFSKIGQTQNALLEAESHGVPTDGCSFHRAALGYVFKNYYPKAKYLAATTTLCDSNPKTVGICQSITGKPATVLDVPYDLDDDSVDFLAQQLKDFTNDLEKSFGLTLDKDSLKERIECSNRTRSKMIEINQLRTDPHSPLSGSSALGLIVDSHLLCGSDCGEKFYDLLLNEIKEKIKIGKDGENGQKDEKIKILWLELKPYFSNNLLSNMEDKLGVRIVFEEINYVYWDEMDPDKPYESLARKMISNHNNGPLENRLKVINMLTNQYNVDGVIMFASWGCRRNSAAVPAIKDELNKSGIPLLVLYGDCIDDSAYTDGQFSTRVEGFLEMLRNGRKNEVTRNLQEEVVNCY